MEVEDSLSLQEINKLNNTLDNYSNDVSNMSYTSEASDMNDISIYFTSLNIYTDLEKERLERIETFKYRQEIGYKYMNNIVCINMNDENINIINNLSLDEINELTDTLDKYRGVDIGVITRELSNDLSDLSKYFMKFNIYYETKQYLMYHYYDNIIII
jgi:predicted transport protein